MTVSFVAFTGTNREYEQLKKALENLFEEGIRSPSLLARLETFKAREPYRSLYTAVMPDYGMIDRLRGARRTRDGDRPNRSNNEPFVNLLWAYIQTHHPGLIKLTPEKAEVTDPFYHHLLRFYDVNENKSISRLSQAVGRYALYHFSERCRPPKEEQHGVVLGELFIKATNGGNPFTAEEHESYDGVRFKEDPASEDSRGYCAYKHDSIVIMLASDDAHRTPKWYLFDHPRVSSKKKGISSMTGHMCQLVSGRDLFTSPVVARRISDTDPIEFNIYLYNEIRKDVMDRLLVNTLPGFYELKREAKSA